MITTLKNVEDLVRVWWYDYGESDLIKVHKVFYSWLKSKI